MPQALNRRKPQLGSRAHAPFASGRSRFSPAAEGNLKCMLDLQKLETFRVLACTCSFTRTALELGYGQSTVTFHIKALERELGAVLFERERFARDVTLTDAGRSALQYAERILALAEEAKMKLRDFDSEGCASELS